MKRLNSQIQEGHYTKNEPDIGNPLFHLFKFMAAVATELRIGIIFMAALGTFHRAGSNGVAAIGAEFCSLGIFKTALTAFLCIFDKLLPAT